MRAPIFLFLLILFYTCGYSQKEQTKVNTTDEFMVFSGFDFIPGENVSFYDDFYQDSIGSFPSKWHTYGSGKIIKYNNSKWFKLNPESAYIPEIASRLANVYTIQFDIIINSKSKLTDPLGSIFFSILSYEGGNGLESDGNGGGTVEIQIAPTGKSKFIAHNWYPGQKEKDTLVIRKSDDILHNKLGKPIRVSFWVNRNRYKMYIDNKKIFDIAKFIPNYMMYDKFRIMLNQFSANQPCEILVSNFRMATNIPDLKYILLNKGKLVTTGLLFDRGSDKIKNISYSSLKAIASALQENPELRIKIIGHTDSEGDENANLLLSKKRAQAVKNYLVKYFHIDPLRLTTDGKGESKPIGTNATPEGRANNRRVEFLKN